MSRIGIFYDDFIAVLTFTSQNLDERMSEAESQNAQRDKVHFFFAISIRIFELWTFSRNEFIVFGSNSNDFIHVSTIWILQL